MKIDFSNTFPAQRGGAFVLAMASSLMVEVLPDGFKSYELNLM